MLYSPHKILSLSPMSRIEETYKEILQKKRERRELVKSLRDELAASKSYEDLVAELKGLREKKKAIESDIKSRSLSDARKLEELALEIRSEQELLSDLALNAYLKGETVEIVDETDAKWTPQFRVTFKKQ